MKSLEGQIAIMQHALDGGAIQVLNKNNDPNHIAFDATKLQFDWNDFDYEIYIPPELIWAKRTEGYAMMVFTDEKSMNEDPSPYVVKGSYYLLGKTEIKLLVDAGLIERK